MTDAGWRAASLLLIVVWVAAAMRLMIVDVWDETNALVAFGSPWWTTHEAVRFVLTKSMGIWRPLPSALAVLVVRGIASDELTWRILRGINIMLLLTALTMFVVALRRWSPGSERRTTLFSACVLYSGGAVITAGWFANLFDAWVLVLIAAGVLLLTRERSLAAGTLFGLAFFCKETAVLALPFLVWLWSARFVSARHAIRAGVPALVLGIVYFVLRGRIIPLGSAADTHQFRPDHFLPTLLGYVESFWRQTLWTDDLRLVGLAFFAVSVIAMPTWRTRAAYLGFILAGAAIYWEMFGIYQNGALMHYLTFVGRLYLIPATLTLFMIAAHRKEWALLVLAVSLAGGAAATYVRYERFQLAYRSLYEQAAANEGTLRVHYPMKPLSDPRRDLEIGDYSDAAYRLDPKTGRLDAVRK